MNIKSRWLKASQALLLCGTIALTGCNNGNLFGGLHDRGDSGDVSTLNSDASIALRQRNYTAAASLFNRVLAQDPDNSEALVGSASALLGSAGVNFGTLLSNLIHQTGGNAGTTGLADAIQSAVETQNVGSNANSILANIDLDRLAQFIDCILFRLKKIIARSADGVISPDEVSLLLSFGFTCLIRGILKPLRKGFLDLKNDDGSLDTEVVTSLADTFCQNSANQQFVENFATDAVVAYAAINQAIVNLANTGSDNQILKDIRSDVDTAVVQLFALGTLPASCLTIINNAGITTTNFREVGATKLREVPTGQDPCEGLTIQ